MADVDFYALPRSVQDRLLASFGREYEPKPILFSEGIRPNTLLWAAITPVSIVALAGLWSFGFGNVDSALARQPIVLMGLYVGLCALAALGVVQALAYRARIAITPWVKGVYLFPATLIDARETLLRVLSADDLTDVAIGKSEVILTFGSVRYAFPVEESHVDRAAEMVKQLKENALGKLPEAERRDLDPLVPPAVVSPLASDVQVVASYPPWLRLRFAVVAAVAVLGVVGFIVRDRTSDEKMFAVAKGRNDVEGYRRYLERGDKHVDVVKRELLPRAELRIAAAEGSVEAIDAFKERFPDTAIGPEVDIARKAALFVSYEKARAEGTLLALWTFDEKYPGHHLVEPVAAARRAIYQKALAALAQKKPPTGELTAAYVGKLLAYAEKVGPSRKGDALIGPEVEVRIRRVPSKSMDLADDLVQKNPYYPGPHAIPSRHFGAAQLDPVDVKAADALVKDFAAQFPADILTFGAGEALPGADEIPAVKVPTIVLSYRVEPSGANFASPKPRGIFVGLGYFFKVDCLMPGEAEPLTLKLDISQRVAVDLILGHDADSGPLEAKLYATMTQRAFETHHKKLMAQWFATK